MNIKAALLTSAIALTVATSAYAERSDDCSKGKMQKRGPSIAHLHEKISNILTKEQLEEFKEMKPKKPHR